MHFGIFQEKRGCSCLELVQKFFSFRKCSYSPKIFLRLYSVFRRKRLFLSNLRVVFYYCSDSARDENCFLVIDVQFELAHGFLSFGLYNFMCILFQNSFSLSLSLDCYKQQLLELQKSFPFFYFYYFFYFQVIDYVITNSGNIPY